MSSDSLEDELVGICLNHVDPKPEGHQSAIEFDPFKDYKEGTVTTVITVCQTIPCLYLPYSTVMSSIPEVDTGPYKERNANRLNAFIGALEVGIIDTRAHWKYYCFIQRSKSWRTCETYIFHFFLDRFVSNARGFANSCSRQNRWCCSLFLCDDPVFNASFVSFAVCLMNTVSSKISRGMVNNSTPFLFLRATFIPPSVESIESSTLTSSVLIWHTHGSFILNFLLLVPSKFIFLTVSVENVSSPFTQCVPQGWD